jgi:probable rRNA maturation factor
MGDAEIRELNATWRELDEPTDVLSFAMQEAEDAEITPDLLGDIAVSVETAARMVASGEHCARVCEELGREIAWGLREEVLFLTVHGFLHLLGFDHAEPEEEREMKAKEREVFFRLLAIA